MEADHQDSFKGTAAYNQESHERIPEEDEQPTRPEPEVPAPLVSPERAVVSLSGTHSLPEQEIGQESGPNPPAQEPELVQSIMDRLAEEEALPAPNGNGRDALLAIGGNPGGALVAPEDSAGSESSRGPKPTLGVSDLVVTAEAPSV